MTDSNKSALSATLRSFRTISGHECAWEHICMNCAHPSDMFIAFVSAIHWNLCYRICHNFNSISHYSTFKETRVTKSIKEVYKRGKIVLGDLRRERRYVLGIYMTSMSVSSSNWGQVTHICIGKLTPLVQKMACRQTLIWTNAGILLIRNLETKFSEFQSEIKGFLFNEMHLKISSPKWWYVCFGLNVLIVYADRSVVPPWITRSSILGWVVVGVSFCIF